MPVKSVTGRKVMGLSDGWQMAVVAPDGKPSDWVAAIVPGTAAQALRAAGRYDLDAPTPLHDKDIWYRLSFAGSGRRTLRFEGLATIAEVWLNGTSILRSDNMFLSHEVDVDLAGDNELRIAFRALDRALEMRKGRARWRTKIVENNALRQVRTTLLGHMTGWHRPVHAVGPWRAVSLIEQAPDLRVGTVDLRPTLQGDDGLLQVSLEIEQSGGHPPATVRVGAVSAVLAWESDGRLAGAISLPGIEKWWPNTHGTPALHQVHVVIGETEIDLGKVGFRTIELDRGGDGRSFALKVNGLPIFARGACWSASDLVTLAGDRESLRPWLALARDAHMNMVRVGGTMVYESDAFLALCDELGLLVWHDFMFANMDYPVADPAFRAEVEAEASQFLRRSQGHPCLAVLCGGSEVAQQVAMMGLPSELWTGPLYEEVLPKAVSALRPDVPYVAHSPGGGDLPFATDSGVAHYYGVGAYLRPLEDARRANVRFTSECLGFANVPVSASPGVSPGDGERWKAATPRDRDTTWDFEDVRDHYLRLLYGQDPAGLRAADWAHYLRLSRAVPADIMEATVAEWRRASSSCTGALVWMFKDFVPGAGWGVVDANGLPKLACHGLRRAFQPVRASVTDEGLNGLGLHLVNDTATARRTRLALLCLQGGATVTLRREREVDLPARSNRTLSSAELIGSFFDVTYAYRFGPPPLNAAVVTLLDAATGERLSTALYFPLGRAALTHTAGLTAEVMADGKGWALRLRSERLAPAVQVEDAHYRAADEGFALLPGEESTVPLIAVAHAAGRPSGTVFTGLGRDLIRY